MLPQQDDVVVYHSYAMTTMDHYGQPEQKDNKHSQKKEAEL